MGTWSYVYDGVGNVTSQTDNRSITTVRSYDELNRVTLINYPNDTDNTFQYDTGKKGTLAIATDSAGTVFYTYDNRLRKTQEQRTINGTTKTTQFSYDAANRMTTQTNPDGEVLAYIFNAQGEIESASASATLISNIDYNALNKITRKDYVNGATTNYTYNSTDFRLNRIQTGSLQDLNYTYDNVGNVSTILDNVASKTQYFTYDDLDRLKTASESAGYNHTFDYNSIGNLTKFTNSGVDTNYTYSTGAAGPHALTESTATTSAAATDDWATGSIDTTKWNNWGGSQNSIVSDQMRITSTLSSGYYGLHTGPSSLSQNLTDSSVVNQLVSAGNQSLTSWEVYPIVINRQAASNYQLYFMVSGNTLYAKKQIAGTNTTLQSASYNSSNHKYFKIRESSGTVYFDTSSDGLSWTNFTSTTVPFDITSVVAGMEVGTWQTEASTTYATFDNFNLPPVTASVIDDWASGSVSNARWVNWNSSQTTIQSNQLKLSSTTASGYYGLDSGVSTSSQDLTGSSVVNQLVNAGNQSISSWEVYPILIFKKGDTSNQLLFFVSNNTVYARKQVSGSNTTIHSASYNSSTQKYFRIRESGGTVYFDTSADGQTWTNFTSTATPFTITSVVVGQMVGTWQTEGSTTYALFDNFNVLTPVYQYDENGNLTSDGTNCYEYNDTNQIKKVKSCWNNQTIAEYVYDYNGNRMVKKNYSGGTLVNTVYSWSDSFETKVIVGGSTEATAYYFANNELIAKKNNDGSKYYYHNDHLGSTGVLTNSSGTLVEETKYDPWGGVKVGGTQSKFLYTGQEKDTETGLYYYNARYYNPNIRRFTQPDDIIQNMYDPQTLNRYSYVKNNPLRYSDPSGHFAALLAIAAGAAFTAAFETGIQIQEHAIMTNQNFFQAAFDANFNLDEERVANAAMLGAGSVIAAAESVILAATFSGSVMMQAGMANNNPKLFGVGTGVYNGTLTVGNSKSQNPVKIDAPYKRPNNATTATQKQSVQGQPCSGCGKIEPKMYANHKVPLVQEYYQTGKIDLNRMKSVGAVNAHCSTCSNQQGGVLSGYSKIKAISLGLKK